MKKILMLAFCISSFANLFAQNQKLPGGGGANGCKASCFFTSCEISCSTPASGGSGALCTCAWGFASCACGSGGASRQLIINADAGKKLPDFTAFLRNYSVKEASDAASKAEDIWSKALRGDFSTYSDDLALYNSYIGKLTESQQAEIFDFLSTLSKPVK